jgi:hypothetical protein
MKKPSLLLLDILSCSPRGFASPLSHAQTFQEPLEQRSGAANADVVLDDDGCSPKRRGGEVVIIRHPNYVSPGTFGKFEGKLRKASTSSSITGMHWHNPAGHSRTKRHNPSTYAFGPTVKELEHAQRTACDELQRKALRKLCKREPARNAKPSPPASEYERLELLGRITAHNGPQSQGPRDRPRMSCPELEKRKPRRRKQPPVSPAERAAALALLNTPISIPRASFTPPKRPRRTPPQKPAPITADPLYSKLITAAATTTRSAWTV